MQKDRYGFIVPVVDKNVCIDCGLCIKVCPANFKPETKINSSFKSYAMYNKEDAVTRQSSSGGIFYAISGYVIEELHGVVFGAVMDEQMQVKIAFAEHIKDIKRMMGSKYVYSSTAYTFRETKKYLEKGKYVLYSGLPCQIAGLLSYLGKHYQRLITVEVLCHGAPSQGLFDKYIKEVEKTYGKTVKRIIHRDGTMDWNPLIQKRITIEFENGDTISRKEDKDIYMSLFIRELCYNAACYSCQYAKPDRIADITLGDYGGLGAYKKYCHKNKNGVSFVRINSQKASNIMQKLDGIYMEQRPDEEIGIMNSAIVAPTEKSEKSKKFMEDYRNMEYDLLFQKYFYKDYRYKLRCIAKNMVICLLGPQIITKIICYRRTKK